MLNLTRLHLGIAHESQFQGLGISADFVAEVADESRKLRGRSAGAVAYHSLRWKRWLEATALAPSTRLQRDLTLIPRMGRPAVAAGRRAWPACGGSARWLPA